MLGILAFMGIVAMLLIVNINWGSTLRRVIMNKPITDKQTNYIIALVTERASVLGISADRNSVIDFIGNAKLFTTRDASEMIEKLKAITPSAASSVTTSPLLDKLPAEIRAMNVTRCIVNKFGKDCWLCGNRVDAGSGLAYTFGDKGWTTIHADGGCPQPKEGSRLHVLASSWISQNCPSRGYAYFALPSHTGNNDLDFYSLTPNLEGVMVLRRILGGQQFDSCPVTSLTEAKRVIGKLQSMTTEEIDDAQKAFADNLGRCFRCGRTLTDEVSRARGIGSDCAKKLEAELAVW